MDDDRAFLDAILAAPDDAAVRLDYADWLDEHAQPERAEFLRADVTLSSLAENDPKRLGLRKRLCDLQPTVGAEWSARIDRTTVEGCIIDEFMGEAPRHRGPSGLAVEVRCPRQWDNLTPTDDPVVRRCGTCNEQVYHCDSVPLARQRAERGHCVAIGSHVIRQKGDFQPGGGTSWLDPTSVIPPPSYRIGDRVYVCHGPFGGHRGTVRGIKPSRLRATVEIVIAETASGRHRLE